MREFVTVNGEPCDQVLGEGSTPITMNVQKGHHPLYTYHMMHMGPYTNPRVQWVRSDRFSKAPQWQNSK